MRSISGLNHSTQRDNIGLPDVPWVVYPRLVEDEMGLITLCAIYLGSRRGRFIAC